MNVQQVLDRLHALADPEKIAVKERRFGITARNSLGVYQQDLAVLAKAIGRDDRLALALFDTDIYEARLLCSKIYDPASVTETLMDEWANTFENWEICDSFCMGLFAPSKHALTKAFEWSEHEQEFIKRAGFVIMAAYGFVNKTADNRIFTQFFPAIEREAGDERVYVKKAVNWALRNIGKRNIDLNRQAIAVAKQILGKESKSARWIAKNALNELEKPDVCILDYPRSIYGSETSSKHKARR